MIKTTPIFCGLACVLSIICSFTGIKDDNISAKVLATVYNKNGKNIEVNIDIQYSEKDSTLELYDFRGNIKTVYKGKKYKIKPYNVERIEFMLFNKQHVFYSHTDKLKRLYYFFHAENKGNLKLLQRKIRIPEGALAGPGHGGAPPSGFSASIDIGISGDYSAYSLIRTGEEIVTDIEDGRLTLMLEKYLKDCPELIEKLDAGEFEIHQEYQGQYRLQKYLNIIEYYNKNCSGENTPIEKD